MGVKEIQISLMVNEEQLSRLEKLLPAWRNMEYQGKKPFENLTVEGLFQKIMIQGSCSWINDRIWSEEYRQENDALLNPERSNTNG